MRKSLRILFFFIALFTGSQLYAQSEYEYYDRTAYWNETEEEWVDGYDHNSEPAWITTVNSDEWYIGPSGGVAVGENGDFYFGSNTYGSGGDSGHTRGTVTSPNFDTNTPLTLELDFTQSNHGQGNDKNILYVDFLVTYKDKNGVEKKKKISIKLNLVAHNNNDYFVITEYSWENDNWIETSTELTTGNKNNNVYTFVVQLPDDYGSDGHTQISINAGGGLYIGAGSGGSGGNTIDVYGDNLVLRDDWDNTERLRRNAGKKMKKVTIVRSYDKGWYTLCLPFDLTMKQFQRRFMASFKKADADTYTWKEATSAEIWEYSSFSNNIMQFRKKYEDGSDATVLNAAVPYLIYVPESIESTLVDFTSPAYTEDEGDDIHEGDKVMVFTNITLADAETLFGTANVVENETGYKFVSNLSKTDLADVMADNQIYYLHTDSDGENPKLYKPNDQSTNIKGFRAYFTAPKEGTTTNPSALSFENSLTSIGSVELPSIDEGLVYNLQGQLVNKTLKELPRGIYIVNHKKYVVK